MMTTEAPVSLEAIKLRLINNPESKAPYQEGLLNREAIENLIRALEGIESAYSTEIENILVNAGSMAVPALIKGLGADHIKVRSVCTMALIRLGNLSEDALLKAYPRYSKKPKTSWIMDFIFEEIGLSFPSGEVTSSHMKETEDVLPADYQHVGSLVG